MSHYEHRRIWFPLEELSHSQLQKIRQTCYGLTMGNHLVIHEVFWLEAYEVLTKGGNTKALTGIQQLLDSGGKEPAYNWRVTHPELNQFPLLSGSTLRDYQAQGAAAIVEKDMLLADDMGTGKQQPVDTKVLTPYGWTTMGQLKVGDYVIGSDGLPTQVTGVFPQGIKPSYRLHFSDHSSVEAGPEHLWTMNYWKGGRNLSPLTLTTDEIRTRPVKDGLNLSKVKLQLPMLDNPVQFHQTKLLPIEPYFLGAMIANGSMCSDYARLTIADQDWLNHYKTHLTNRIIWGKTRVYGNVRHIDIPRIYLDMFKKLELTVKSGDKFIPKNYLYSNPICRINLLQGLMDGDGSCSQDNNRLSYSTTSQQLAMDVVELVQGLGGIASYQTYDRDEKGIEYVVRLRVPPTIKPFSLERKLERYRPGHLANPTRTVMSVEYVRDVESVCISVDAEDNLYVTENYILTHNTVQVLAARNILMRRHHCAWRTIVLVPSAEVAASWKRIAMEHYGEFVWHIEDRGDFRKRFMPLTGIWIIMYSKFWRDGFLEHIRHELSCGKAMLVCDEFHRCAGQETKQYHHVCELRELAYRFVGATGTSVPNKPDSYHSIYTITTKQSNLMLEYWTAYFSRGLTDPTGKKPEWDLHRLKSIYQLKGTYSLRRLKSEVAELPPLTGPMPIVCPMSAQQRKHYVELHNQNKTSVFNELTDSSDEITIGHFYAKNIRLYQASTLPALLGITGEAAEPKHKLDRLIGLLEEAGDQRTIIWCNFPDCIEWLAGKLRIALPGQVIKTAHGGVTQSDRTELIDQFQAGLINHLVANPAVWGEGVNMTRASITIYWDLHPSRVRWRQSQDRAYRIGQKLPHTIYVLLHEDSIDIHTLNWLGTKDTWADAIESGKGERQMSKVKTVNPYMRLKQ